MEQSIDILGASGAALSMIFELITQQPNTSSVRIIKNVLERTEIAFAVENLSYDILQVSDVNKLAQKLFLGVYKENTKKIVYNFFQKRFQFDDGQFINLIHPSAVIASTAEIGKGIQINPMSTIASYAVIENFVSINRHVSVGHHTTVGRFSTLNPNVHIAGHCHIEEGVTMGIGATVVDSIQIGKNSIIGAGALVTKNIPAGVVVMGIPAKIVKTL
ncbi:MAG: acetyltransferase [Thermonemataceae bacterium]